MTISLTPDDKKWIASQTSKGVPKSLINQQPDSLWQYFTKSEEKFIACDFDNPDGDDSANAEYGLVLHTLNHLVDKNSKAVLKKLGLPESKISPDGLQNIVAISGITDIDPVTANGSLVLQIPFAGIDAGWAVAGAAELLRKAGIIKTEQFHNTPPIIDFSNKQEKLRIAVIGDWGTGNWNDGNCPAPAILVGNAVTGMKDELDILIHLGDVYYAGRGKEEAGRLLTGFPKLNSGFHFTLNSNHEMYTGAAGYFSTALQNPIFINQANTSFFAIKFGKYVIICLDSAYYDQSSMVGQGALSAGNEKAQLKFITDLNIKSENCVIVMTHHPALNFQGTEILPVYNEVKTALGRNPEYWYYGHVHDEIVYTDLWAGQKADYKTVAGNYPRLRCVGHSAIPFGAPFISNNQAEYFAHTPYPDNTCMDSKWRVLNGFAIITLDGEGISEKMFETHPDGTVLQAWPVVPNIK